MKIQLYIYLRELKRGETAVIQTEIMYKNIVNFSGIEETFTTF